MPQADPMCSRLLEQQLQVALGSSETAAPQGDRTCSLAESVAKRKHVSNGACIRGRSFENMRRLIRKAKQPKPAGLEGPSGDTLVKLEANDMGTGNWSGVAAQHAVNVLARTQLIAEEMQRDADHPIAHQWIDRIG